MTLFRSRGPGLKFVSEILNIARTCLMFEMQLSLLPNLVRQLVHEEKHWVQVKSMINDCTDPYSILSLHYPIRTNRGALDGSLVPIGGG